MQPTHYFTIEGAIQLPPGTRAEDVEIETSIAVKGVDVPDGNWNIVYQEVESAAEHDARGYKSPA
jgi:hypothetical protein